LHPPRNFKLIICEQLEAALIILQTFQKNGFAQPQRDHFTADDCPFRQHFCVSGQMPKKTILDDAAPIQS
jgi:hypothetical protein